MLRVMSMTFGWTLLLTSGLLGSTVYAASPPTGAGGMSWSRTEPKTRTLEFTYTAMVHLPTGARKLDIWLPVPQSDGNQDVLDVRIKAPYPTTIGTDPEYGNAILHLSADHPPESSIAVEMKFLVRRQESLHHDFAEVGPRTVDPPMPRWLEPDRRVPLDNRIRDLAAEVTAGKQTVPEKIRAIYDYVVSTMTYEKKGTGWGQGDIYYACDSKRGNCTDFHALFIGLSRAVGIPTTFEIGFAIPTIRGTGQIAGYHCWAKFFHQGFGWVPVDASEGNKNPAKREYFFGAHDENRILFTIGRDIRLEPEQAAEPINFFIYPYVELDGKKFTKVDKKFTYRDVSESSPVHASR